MLYRSFNNCDLEHIPFQEALLDISILRNKSKAVVELSVNYIVCILCRG